jgi:hypothetical protein
MRRRRKTDSGRVEKTHKYAVDWFRVFAFRVANRVATFQVVPKRLNMLPHPHLDLDQLVVQLTKSLSTANTVPLSSTLTTTETNTYYTNIRIVYQSDQFNGLRLRLQRCCQILTTADQQAVAATAKTNSSALIFANGKVILSGFSQATPLKQLACLIYYTIMLM